MYQIDPKDDLQSVELMRNLPFEAQIISITDVQNGSPETRLFCMTNWGEDFVDSSEFIEDLFGGKKTFKKLVKNKQVTIDFAIHNHPDGPKLDRDIVLLPSGSDLTVFGEKNMVISRFGNVVYHNAPLSVDALIDTLPQDSRRLVDAWKRELDPNSPANDLTRIPFFQDFLFDYVLATTKLAIAGRQRNELSEAFRDEKNQGMVKKLQLAVLQVPITITEGKISDVRALLSAHGTVPEYDITNDTKSYFVQQLLHLIDVQEKGIRLDEIMMTTKAETPEDAFFNAIKMQDKARMKIRYVHGVEEYLLPLEANYKLLLKEPAKPEDTGYPVAIFELLSDVLISCCKAALETNSSYTFTFNQQVYRVTPQHVREMIEQVKISK